MQEHPIVSVISPYKDDVIVCLETSADLQLLSNGAVYQGLFRVYSLHDIDDDSLTVEVVSEECFNSKDIVIVDDLRCTSPVQTVLDLLEYEHDVDIQALVEVLANYYFSHGKSFADLELILTDEQRKALSKWREAAETYYARG